MITHVVLFKLKPEHRDEAAHCRDLLATLPPRIEQIKFYELGLNMIESDRAYDLSLYSKFDSLETLEIYQKHPEHQAVVHQITPHMASIVAVDYESEA